MKMTAVTATRATGRIRRNWYLKIVFPVAAEAFMVYIDDVRKARTLFLLILLMCFLDAGNVFTQEKVSIAVFPFTGAGLSALDLRSLTLIFEESLARFDSLEVIDQSKRERVLAYLEPSLLTCEDVDCAIKAGRMLSADTIVLGTVSRIGEQFVISARVMDLRTGKSRKAESAGSRSVAEMAPATRLLASTLFGAAAPGISTGEGAEAGLDSAQGQRALESLATNLKATIAEIDRKRVVAQTWGWVFMGIGVISAGLAGACWYMSDQAYKSYTSTSDTAVAANFRSQVTLWDTLMLVSAGTGVLCVGGSIPFFALSPNSRDETKELKRIEAEMSALGNTQGTKK
jgi:TolB-like protein